MQVTPPSDLDEINEADDLRAEDRAARYDARIEELDRKDRAGPHWIYR